VIANSVLLYYIFIYTTVMKQCTRNIMDTVKSQSI